jgi:hypothetical protein
METLVVRAKIPTRTLLLAGAAAGPLFLLASGVGMLTRSGFDLRVLPISALSLGSWGWTQIATFIVSGLLGLAGAVGVRRVSRGLWGPLLIGGYGLGLLIAGIFVTDPALGFPAGAPAGRPTTITWHALVHSGAAMLAMGAVIMACLVYARSYFRLDQRTQAVVSVLASISIVVTLALPDLDSFGLRLAIACLISSAWLTWTFLTTSRNA